MIYVENLLLNADKYLIDTFKELQFYPYTDHKFISSFIGKNAKKKLEENKKMRKQLIEEIGNYILNFLPEEDIKFIIQLNTIINQK